MSESGGIHEPSASSTGDGHRDVGFDVARAVFMVLGIVSHAAVIYREGDPWRVSSDQSHVVFTWITDFLRAFRMHAFFVIAGYFFATSIQRYGANGALRARIVRLGVPLVFIGWTANGLMNALSTYARLPDSVLEYVLRGSWLGPLWFIGNLIVYCALWALIDAKLRRLALPQEPRALHLAMVTAAVPLASALLSAFGNRVCSSVIVFVSFPQLYEFAPFFALGAFVQARRAWLVELVRPRRALLVLVVALVAMGAATALGLEQRSYTLMFVVRQFMRLALALAILGAFRGVTSPPRWVRRLTAAAYTVYVLHAPVVVVLYVVLEPLELGMVATFLILCVVTAITTLAIHERLVARYPLAEFLINGVRPGRRAKSGVVSTS